MKGKTIRIFKAFIIKVWANFKLWLNGPPVLEKITFPLPAISYQQLLSEIASSARINWPGSCSCKTPFSSSRIIKVNQYKAPDLLILRCSNTKCQITYGITESALASWRETVAANNGENLPWSIKLALIKENIRA